MGGFASRPFWQVDPAELPATGPPCYAASRSGLIQIFPGAWRGSFPHSRRTRVGPLANSETLKL